MKLSLALLLIVPGMLLLATPVLLPLGLLMMWGGWWVYERSRVPDRDGLITLMMVLGGLGAAAIVWQFAAEAIARI